jgi:hypothetical protein
VRIGKAVKRLNIGKEIIQYCFIGGLLPSLREKVLAKGVTSLEETLKMARIAECCTQTDPVHTLLMDTLKSNNELAQKQEKVIRTLNEKFESLLKPEVELVREEREKQKFAGPPLQRDRIPYNSNRAGGQPFQNRRPPKFNPRREQMQQYANQQRPVSTNNRQVPFTSSSTNSTSLNYNNGSNNNTQVCRNCLRSHRPGQCLAFGQQCNLCGRWNHYSRACLSSRPY